MTNKILCIASVILLTFLFSCSKSGGSSSTTTPPVTEENIVFSIDIDPGSTIFAALGVSQDAKIIISSKLPTAGVTLDLQVRKDLDNSLVSSSTLTSNTAAFTSTITSLPAGTVCTATFTVTSKTKPTNSAVKSFKIARK